METAKILRSRRLGVRNDLVAYSFILPNFLGFAVFTLVPMVFSLALSFAEWNGTGDVIFVGVENFLRLFRDEAFVRALLNTAIYTALVVPLTMAAALGLAMLLNSKINGRNFFRTIAFFPYVKFYKFQFILLTFVFRVGRAGEYVFERASKLGPAAQMDD